MRLSVQYRGALTSCNYSCGYCPFAKRKESESRLALDRDSLNRFVNWISEDDSVVWKVLLTPWGEALVRRWYQQAVASLTRLVNVELVTAQTNLSWGLDWIDECESAKLGFRATYHPTETDRSRFLKKVLLLWNRGIQVSVGMVGQFDALKEIEILRREVPDEIPMWINPLQPRSRPYTEEEREIFTKIDPMFPVLEKGERSSGRSCIAGELEFTVDEFGDMRRCHFVDAVIGNIFQADWKRALTDRPCPNQTCRCYLGISRLKGWV